MEMVKNILRKNCILLGIILAVLLLPVHAGAEVQEKVCTTQNGRLCDANGNVFTGWRTEDGKKFYYESGKNVQAGRR